MTPSLPRAHGAPLSKARLRAVPEDFQVTEILGFEPSGTGEHLFVAIRKRDWTTEAVAKHLAERCGVPRRAVEYAGMKDRRAVTEQWFSVHLPGREADLAVGESLADGVSVRALTRNDRKLRRGALAGNRFRLVLRDVDATDYRLSLRLRKIAYRGVPNYFGEQRFGRDGDNVARAREWFEGRWRPRGRHVRSVLLSAVRAELFNRVLAARVADGTWDRLLPGDAAQLDGRGSLFSVEATTPELAARAARLDVHPTGPLPGRGKAIAGTEIAAWEAGVLEAERELVNGLEQAGLEAARRALRLRVAGLRWHSPSAGVLVIGFSLPAGAYATSVVRELVEAADS